MRQTIYYKGKYVHQDSFNPNFLYILVNTHQVPVELAFTNEECQEIYKEFEN